MVHGELCVLVDEDVESDILSYILHNLTAFRGITLNISKHDCVNKLAIFHDVQLLQRAFSFSFSLSKVESTFFLNSGL